MAEWRQKFVICECGCHALSISILEEDGQEPLEISIAFWSYGHGSPTSWRERLRHIWHIMRYGQPYLDDVWLSQKDAQKLGEALIEVGGR